MRWPLSLHAPGINPRQKLGCTELVLGWKPLPVGKVPPRNFTPGSHRGTLDRHRIAEAKEHLRDQPLRQIQDYPHRLLAEGGHRPCAQPNGVGSQGHVLRGSANVDVDCLTVGRNLVERLFVLVPADHDHSPGSGEHPGRYQPQNAKGERVLYYDKSLRPVIAGAGRPSARIEDALQQASFDGLVGQRARDTPCPNGIEHRVLHR